MWVCLKIVYPYTQWLMIIIPMKNGYFIGGIPNIFRQTHVAGCSSLFSVLVTLVIHLDPLGSTWQGLYLSECQLLVSDPGAVNQMWHCDAWLGDKTNVKAGGYTFTFTDICMSTGLEK